MEDKKLVDSMYQLEPDALYPTQEQDSERKQNVYSEVAERKKRHIRLTFGRSNFRALIVPFISTGSLVLAMHMSADVVAALVSCSLEDIEGAIGKMTKLDGTHCFAYWKNNFLIFKASKWVYYGESERNDGATLNFSRDSAGAVELFFTGDDEAQECELTVKGVIADLNETEKARLADVLSRTSTQTVIVSFLSSARASAEFRLADPVLDVIGPFSAVHMVRAIDCNECLVEIDDSVIRLVKPDVRDPGASYMVLSTQTCFSLVFVWIFVILAVLWTVLGGVVYNVLGGHDATLYVLPIVLLVGCSLVFVAVTIHFWKRVKSERAIAALPSIDFVL